MTVVRFEVATSVTYHFCRRCETSSWLTTEGHVEVNEVLEVARSIEPAGRRARIAA
jgi:hypothetical protein